MAVCARLKAFRADIGYPRRLFANQAGLDSSTIVRIELGRGPLRYEVARRICDAFDINPVWLATGKDLVRLWRRIPRANDLGASPDSLFTEVFDTNLASKLRQEDAAPQNALPKAVEPLTEHIKSLGEAIACMFLGANRSDEHRAAALVEVLNNPLPVPEVTIEAARALAESLQRSLVEKSGGPLPPSWSARLSSMLEPGKLLHTHYEYILKRAAEAAEKKQLTDSEIVAKSVAVKSQLPGLLERLKKATAEPGKKTALAEFLKVPLASVSRWLSGEREPGGEVTLQLLRWVERQEGQSK